MLRLRLNHQISNRMTLRDDFLLANIPLPQTPAFRAPEGIYSGEWGRKSTYATVAFICFWV
jgi:hypothetical protein